MAQMISTTQQRLPADHLPEFPGGADAPIQTAGCKAFMQPVDRMNFGDQPDPSARRLARNLKELGLLKALSFYPDGAGQPFNFYAMGQ